MKLNHLVPTGARGPLGRLVTILVCSAPGDGPGHAGTTAHALACISEQEAAAAQPWTLGKQYKFNEQVRFDGRTYACTQPVCVAQQGWEPGAAGLWALWQLVPLCGVHRWETLTAYDT